MRAQRLLDLPGIDVLAAGDDHVLLAIDHEHEILVVEVAEVAGMHPAIAQGRHRRRGIVPIAVHQARTAHQDLADLAGGGIAPIRPRDADGAAQESLACRREPLHLRRRPVEDVLRRRQQRGDDALGHAIDLGEDRPERGHRAPQGRHRHRRRRVVNGTQGRLVGRGELRAVEQALHHDRREMRGGHALGRDRAQDRGSVEARVQHDGGAHD